MLFPQKSFITAINTSHDALDLQNVAQIPKVSFTVGQSRSVSHLTDPVLVLPHTQTMHYGMFF